jgi:hypothetical protein
MQMMRVRSRRISGTVSGMSARSFFARGISPRGRAAPPTWHAQAGTRWCGDASPPTSELHTRPSLFLAHDAANSQRPPRIRAGLWRLRRMKFAKSAEMVVRTVDFVGRDPRGWRLGVERSGEPLPRQLRLRREHDLGRNLRLLVLHVVAGSLLRQVERAVHESRAA